MSMPQATYLTVGAATPNRSRKLGAILSVLAVLATIFVGALTLSTSAPTSANAGIGGGLVCGGSNDVTWLSGDRTSWATSIQRFPSSDRPGRRWTLQEAYGAGVKFADYAGEGGKDQTFVKDVGEKRGVDGPSVTVDGKAQVGNWDKVKGVLKEPRTAGNCVPASLLYVAANGIMQVTNFTVLIVQNVVVLSFDSAIICKNVTNPTGSCVNLVGIVGGTSNNGKSGIMNALTNSVYMPLMVIVALISGLWMLKKAFRGKQFRDAMQGAVWVFAAVMFGVVILAKPMLAAKAPMVVTNTVASCIIGAFNGTDCTTGASSINSDATSFSSAKICVSNANGVSVDDRMAMAMNSMSCNIWKAFVLEPFSQGSFGRSFEQMDVKDAETKKLIAAAGLKDTDFCVSLRSAGSADSYRSGTLELEAARSGTNAVCNVAAYQLYLATDAKAADDKRPEGAFDKRWMKLAVLAANDKDMTWTHWSASPSNGFALVGIALMSLFTAVAGTPVLLVAALMALVYLMVSIIRFAILPLFALIGIHPGQGRTLLLGWVEGTIGNVLKYIVSAVFVMITVIFYGAILGNLNSITLSFIVVMVVSAALYMYRGELMNTFGRVNMGGKELSNQFQKAIVDRARKVSNRSERLGRNMAGGAVGGALAAGVTGPRGLIKTAREQGLGAAATQAAAPLSGAASGSIDGARRDLRRGRGFISSAVTESERFQRDNRRDLQSEAGQVIREADNMSNELEGISETRRQERGVVDSADQMLDEGSASYQRAIEDASTANAVAAGTLSALAASEPLVAELAGIRELMAQNATNLQAARAAGDQVAVIALTKERHVLKSQFSALAPVTRISQPRREALARQDMIDIELHDLQVKLDITPDVTEGDQKRRVELQERINALSAERTSLGTMTGGPANRVAFDNAYSVLNRERMSDAGLDDYDEEATLSRIRQYEMTAFQRDRAAHALQETQRAYEELGAEQAATRARGESMLNSHQELNPGSSFRGTDRRSVDRQAEEDAAAARERFLERAQSRRVEERGGVWSAPIGGGQLPLDTPSSGPGEEPNNVSDNEREERNDREERTERDNENREERNEHNENQGEVSNNSDRQENRAVSNNRNSNNNNNNRQENRAVSNNNRNTRNNNNNNNRGEGDGSNQGGEGQGQGVNENLENRRPGGLPRRPHRRNGGND